MVPLCDKKSPMIRANKKTCRLIYPLKWLLASLRLLLFFVIVSLYYFPMLFVHQFVKLSPKARAEVRRRCLRMCVRMMGFVYNLDDERPKELPYDKAYLYVCNHRSWSDPLIALGILDALPISKAEVKDIPVIGAGMSFTGIVYLERMNKESHQKVRREIARALANGTSVLIFPEGTTFTTAQTGAFKRGAFEQALSVGAAIIPMVIEYKDKHTNYWDVRSMWQQFVAQCGKVYNTTYVWIGAPLDPEGKSAAELTALAHRIINRKIEQVQHNWDGHI